MDFKLQDEGLSDPLIDQTNGSLSFSQIPRHLVNNTNQDKPMRNLQSSETIFNIQSVKHLTIHPKL